MTSHAAGTADVNKTHLYYEVEGEGAPLVFVNPGALDCRLWDDQWSAFAASHRAIRYDPRGWGRSDDVRASFSPLEDLDALLEFLEVKRCHLLGASWGAALAIDYALARPARIEKLVLLGAAPSGAPIPPDVMERLRPVVLAIRENPSPGIDAWLETPGLGIPNATAALKARVRGNALDNLRYWSIDRRLMQAADPPARERLGAVTAPTLVLTGEHEQPFMRSMADLLSREIPGAALRVIPAAGHLANLENAASFNSEVLAFLEA